MIDESLIESPKSPSSRDGQSTVGQSEIWLLSVQRENGSWQDSPRHTGLALLVYLAQGKTPLSEKYGLSVKNAIAWSADYMAGLPDDTPLTTDQTILLYALSQAYGTTRIHTLKAPCQAGLARLIADQRADGGWGDTDAATYDREQTWWSAHALVAIYMAVIGDPETVESTVERVLDAIKQGQFADGQYIGEPRHAGMTVDSLQILGQRRSPEARAGIRFIATNRRPLLTDCVTNDSHLPTHPYLTPSLPALLADTNAMFDAQGTEWREWQQVFEKAVIKSKTEAGYWDVPRDGRAVDSLGDRIEATCLMMLPLEVFYIYRHRPVFEPLPIDGANATTLDATDSGLIIR